MRKGRVTPRPGEHLWELWGAGKAAVNGWLAIPSSFSAEIMAGQRFDSLTVDLQHGLVDYHVATEMFQAVSGAGLPVLAHVPWNEPATIMKLLDAGADGLICPMINTASEARAFVEACYYPPDGYRSFGPARASLVFGPEYAAVANRDLVTLAMIETRAAAEHLDEILEVKGLDGVFVGPADLGLSYGLPAAVDHASGVARQVVDKVARACKEHGKIAGIFTGSADYAREMVALGYQFVTLASDSSFLAAKAGAELAAFGTD